MPTKFLKSNLKLIAILSLLSGVASAGELNAMLFGQVQTVAQTVALNDDELVNMRGQGLHMPVPEMPVVLWDELDNGNHKNIHTAPPAGAVSVSITGGRP